MRKYFEIFKYSLKTQFAFIYNYIFSIASFAIHVFVFNELWDFILKGKEIVGYTKSELIWYIIIAECILYSGDKKFNKIGDMVKQGDIANMLIKPVDTVNYFIAETTASLVKCFINLGVAFILGVTLAGPINYSFGSIFLALIAFFMGVFIHNLLQIFIGIIAFYTEENKSFWMVVQKIAFFVVFTPLEFYPKIVQNILLCLPTTYFVYVPSKIFVNFEFGLALGLIGLEILSGLVIYGAIRLVYKKGAERINVNGG